MTGKIGAIIDTHNADVEVRVPLALVRSVLHVTQYLPESVRDSALEALKSVGIALDKDSVDDRLIRQLSNLNIEVKTQTMHVRVFAE